MFGYESNNGMRFTMLDLLLSPFYIALFMLVGFLAFLAWIANRIENITLFETD